MTSLSYDILTPPQKKYLGSISLLLNWINNLNLNQNSKLIFKNLYDILTSLNEMQSSMVKMIHWPFIQMSSNILQQNQTKKSLWYFDLPILWYFDPPKWNGKPPGKNDMLIIHLNELKHSTRKSDSKNLMKLRPP